MNNKRMATETGNNNPDLNRDKVIDFNNGEFEIIKENEDLRKLYDLRNREMERVITAAEKEIADSKGGIGDITKGLEGIKKVSYKDRRAVTQEQMRIENQINDLEYEALKIPDDLEDGMSNIVKFKTEIPESVRELKNETKELVDELKFEREAFVKKFIVDSSNEIRKHFGSAFRKTINGENAKDAIIYKTKKEIESAAKSFIETGDEADFGFEAVLEITSYDKTERGIKVNKKFITEYAIIIGGYERKIRRNDNLRGSKFVPGSQINEINHKRGEVETEEIN